MEGHITKSTDNAVSTDAPRAQEGIAVARRHHYVPRCYLKGFSVPRKKGQQVVVFDRVSRRSFQTATTNVAVEMDFNRIEGFNRGRLEIDCDPQPPRCSVPARRPSWRTSDASPGNISPGRPATSRRSSDIVAFADFVSPSLRLKARVWIPEGDNQPTQ